MQVQWNCIIICSLHYVCVDNFFIAYNLVWSAFPWWLRPMEHGGLRYCHHLQQAKICGPKEHTWPAKFAACLANAAAILSRTHFSMAM